MNTPVFPIMTWHGPNLDRFTAKAMGHLAEGGFNTAYVILRRDQLRNALDIARDVGVRLLVAIEDTHNIWRKPGIVDAAWLDRFRETIRVAKDHPALFGYMVCDEPVRMMFDDIGRAYAAWKEADPGHMFYVNHWAVGQTYQGARSYEDLWEALYACAKPGLVSADLYPIQLVSEQDLRENAGQANYFPRHKARLVPHFFEMLDMQRQYAARWNLPLWAFTLARPEYGPGTAHGEMCFQLMCGLAYGAKGLQYFSYEHENMLMEDDGTPTDNWQVARQLNLQLAVWGPIMQDLRSIGVYHHPADLFYTRPLDQFMLGAPTDMFARGDAIVVGHFTDADDREVVMIVNRNPFEPAVVNFSFGTSGVEACSPATGAWSVTSGGTAGQPARLTFAPGQARLYRFQRQIALSSSTS